MKGRPINQAYHSSLDWTTGFGTSSAPVASSTSSHPATCKRHRSPWLLPKLIRLFIFCKQSFCKDISKNTICGWIWTTILHTYEDEGLPHSLAFNPHEVGALAATMSLHCNTLFINIASGCHRATHSGFANHYFRVG